VDWLDRATHFGAGWWTLPHTIRVQQPTWLPTASRFVSNETNPPPQTIHIQPLPGVLPIPPEAPTDLVPSGGGAITDRTPLLTWTDPLGNATWFRVSLHGPQGQVADSWMQQAQHQVASSLGAGTYRWWAYSLNSQGPGGWTGPAVFEIQAQVPGAANPVGPTGQLAVGARRPQFSWQAATDADWYHVIVSRQGVGHYASQWIQHPATVCQIAGDFPAGNYRWWVAAWNPDGYGPWSAGTDFSVPAMLPDPPVPRSPTGGVAIASASVDYQWAADNRAVWYQLWSGRNGAGFHQQWYSAATVVSGATATATVGNHMWGEHQWYVRGWGPDGLGSWSQPGGQFVFGQPAFLVGAADVLTWDELSAGANWYQVWINDVTGGGRVKERAWWFPIGDTTPVTGGRSVDLNPNLSTGDYEWTIRAWSSTFGQGPWSDADTFSVP